MKLTQQQLEALFSLLEKVLKTEPVDSLQESLYKNIMLKVFIKVRNKMESFPKRDYSLQLNPIEAIGFYLYWENFYFSNEQIYERTLIRSKIDEIDKAFA